MQKFESYEAFNEAEGFEARAGFALAPLQVQDVNTVLSWGRALLGYEVGGGKTVVSTAVSMIWNNPVTLVVVLPVLVIPWVNWLSQVSERVIKYGGPGRKKIDLTGCRWIVCTHEIFRRDFVRLATFLSKQSDYDIIVDEAHALKNVESKLFLKTEMLAGVDHGLQELTGTPTSKPWDAYAYIKLNSPECYRSAAHFDNIHVEGKDFFGRVTEWKNLDLMAENFGKRYISRTKEEIHGYNNTPLTPDTSYELSDEHQQLYQKLVDEQLLLLPNDQKIDASTQAKLYHALQQIIINFDFFSGVPENKSEGYCLLDLVLEQVQPENRDRSKLIVWTKYRRTSRSVIQYLKKAGYAVAGAYSEVDSAANTNAFCNDPGLRVLVAQYQSAGAGLNPQAVCWETLALEFDTVPLYMKQAIGRVDRVGQLHKPTIRIARAVNTIQAYLFDQLLNNSDLVESVERSKASLRDILLGNVSPKSSISP